MYDEFTDRNVNIYGDRIKRTPDRCPKSYDNFVIYKDESWRPTDDFIRSVDLYYNDREQYEYASVNTWQFCNTQFGDAEPEDIEVFLKLYYEDPTIRLTGIEQGINERTREPLWIFYFKSSMTDDYE